MLVQTRSGVLQQDGGQCGLHCSRGGVPWLQLLAGLPQGVLCGNLQAGPGSVLPRPMSEMMPLWHMGDDSVGVDMWTERCECTGGAMLYCAQYCMRWHLRWQASDAIARTPGECQQPRAPAVQLAIPACEAPCASHCCVMALPCAPASCCEAGTLNMSKALQALMQKSALSPVLPDYTLHGGEQGRPAAAAGLLWKLQPACK